MKEMRKKEIQREGKLLEFQYELQEEQEEVSTCPYKRKTEYIFLNEEKKKETKRIPNQICSEETNQNGILIVGGFSLNPSSFVFFC